MMPSSKGYRTKGVNMAHGIMVFGASGSGTTTLGRELAQILGFAHLDIDDYF